MIGITNIAEYTSQLDAILENFLTSLGIYGTIISSVLIVVESILPILPVCVFITLIFYKFGNILGFIISWICTCIGCMLAFSLIRSKVKKIFEKRFINGKDSKRTKKIMKNIEKMSLTKIVLIVAIPFTPAFLVNIAAGLSNISKKKFLISILIGKLFMVYFWGYIGTTLIESITHPIYLIKILALLLGAFLISKIINKYFNIE